MVKKTKLSLIPEDLFDKAKRLSEQIGSNHASDGFRVINNLIPLNLEVFRVRKPKSKEEIIIMRFPR